MAHKDITLLQPDTELLRAALHAGIFSRVARQVGADPSHVRRVALGERKSKKVTAALKRELRKIERQLRIAAA
jgi:hypothetical protein